MAPTPDQTFLLFCCSAGNAKTVWIYFGLMIRGLSWRPSLSEGPVATWDLRRSIKEEEKEDGLNSFYRIVFADVPSHFFVVFANRKCEIRSCLHRCFRRPSLSKVQRSKFFCHVRFWEIGLAPCLENSKTSGVWKRSRLNVFKLQNDVLDPIMCMKRYHSYVRMSVFIWRLIESAPRDVHMSKPCALRPNVSLQNNNNKISTPNSIKSSLPQLIVHFVFWRADFCSSLS
jgi:hypothetical protein